MAAAALAPEEVRWAYYNGMALTEIGALDAAAVAFERSLALRPENKAAVLRLADVNRRRGRLEAALAGYEQVIAGGTNLAQGHAGAGRCRLEMGETEAAAGRLAPGPTARP